MLPFEKKKEASEEKQKSEEGVIDFIRNGLRKCFFSFGGIIILSLLCFFAGGMIGTISPGQEFLVARCKYLYLIVTALILIQTFPVALNSLYRESNLPFLMTLPFTPVEIVLAKYLQLFTVPYRIMTVMVLPLWFGYALTTDFDKHLAEAVFTAVLFVPGFILCVLFLVLILAHAYRRLLIPRKKGPAIVIPVMFLVAVISMLLILACLYPGSFLKSLASSLANILFYNFALEAIITDGGILPLLSIVLCNILVILILIAVSSSLYQKTLLQRWDLAGDSKSEKMNTDKILSEHTVLGTLILRELRTVRGLRIYRIPGLMTYFILPIVLGVCIVSCEALVFKSFQNPEPHVMYTALTLLRTVVPLSVIPTLLNKSVATACSRDIHSIESLLVLPVKKDLQLHAKILSSWFLSVMGTLPYIIIACAWMLEQGVISSVGVVLAIPLNLLLIYGIVEFRIMRDIKRMIKDWEKPRDFLKRRGKIPYWLCILMGVFFPVAAGIGLETLEMKQTVALGWLFFLAFFLCVSGYFYLFIQGLPLLEQMGKTDEEKFDKVGRVKKKIVKRIKEKRKNP